MILTTQAPLDEKDSCRNIVTFPVNLKLLRADQELAQIQNAPVGWFHSLPLKLGFASGTRVVRRLPTAPRLFESPVWNGVSWSLVEACFRYSRATTWCTLNVRSSRYRLWTHHSLSSIIARAIIFHRRRTISLSQFATTPNGVNINSTTNVSTFLSSSLSLSLNPPLPPLLSHDVRTRSSSAGVKNIEDEVAVLSRRDRFPWF